VCCLRRWWPHLSFQDNIAFQRLYCNCYSCDPPTPKHLTSCYDRLLLSSSCILEGFFRHASW
jgi:hypothetical protein